MGFLLCGIQLNSVRNITLIKKMSALLRGSQTPDLRRVALISELLAFFQLSLFRINCHTIIKEIIKHQSFIFANMEPSWVKKIKNSLCFAIMASEPELLQRKMSFQQVCRRRYQNFSMSK